MWTPEKKDVLWEMVTKRNIPRHISELLWPTNPPAPRRGATRLRGICSILYIWPPFAMESYYSLAFFAFSHFGSSEGSISHFSCLMSHVSGPVGLFTVPKKGSPSPPNHSGLRIWDDPRILWKFINFRASLQGNKSHENWTQAYPKSWKIDPGIIRSPIFTEVDFCNTSHAKCMFFNPRHRNLDPTTRRKNNLEIDMNKSVFSSNNAQKAFRMGPQNHQKIDKIQAWTPQGPSLCPPMSQDRPRIVPGSPRTPK